MSAGIITRLHATYAGRSSGLLASEQKPPKLGDDGYGKLPGIACVLKPYGSDKLNKSHRDSSRLL
jgi:hypothetical protein